MNERRIAILLAILLFAQLVLVAAQLPVSGARGATLLESAALRLVSPLARAVGAVAELGARTRMALRDRTRVREENLQLHQEMAELRGEMLRLSGIEAERDRLAEALDYTPPSEARRILADVTLIDHSSWLRTMVLYVPESRRSELGIGPDSPVTSSRGLIGRVVAVSGDHLRVQLLTDRASSVGAMVERTRRQGIVRGIDQATLALDYVPLQADVRVGDRVVTAGIDGVYPRGIPIGTVVEVESGADLFYRIRLSPEVDFGVIDQVFVLAGPRLPEELLGSDLPEEPPERAEATERLEDDGAVP